MSFLPRILFSCRTLPALLAALAITVPAFQARASHGPSTTTRPVTVTRDMTPASVGHGAPSTTAAPGTADIMPEKTEDVPPGTLLPPDPVKITMAPIPFEKIRPNDFIVREVIVQNDTPAPVNVEIILKFSSRYYSNGYSRSVRTARQVPPRSRQVIPLFVPAAIPADSVSDSDYLSAANPLIFVNGRSYPVPSGFLKSGSEIESCYLPLPSSFSNEEKLAAFLDNIIGGAEHWPFLTDSLWTFASIETGISGSDTIQWPSIPQFYQSKHILFRKSTDPFTPEAERAFRDAVMLGSTEVLLLMPGSPWPEWAPTVPDGFPAVVSRGLGQSVVIPMKSIRVPASAQPNAQDEEDKKTYHHSSRRDNNHSDFTAVNHAFSVILDEAHIWAANPSEVLLSLPHIFVPAIPFYMILLALLAYIILVGPVNYFIFIRKKKKSVLLLLLTVPVISLIFMAVVILFVTIVEGWTSRASAVGVTFLDQQGNMAYTRAAVSLYSPVPVRKMVFDTIDSVTFSNTKNINISLGRDQVISGVNRARIPVAYAVSRAEKHFEQLKVTETADGMSVMNGLGAPLNNVVLKTDAGEVWTAPRTVEPGETVPLVRFGGRIMSEKEIVSAVEAEGQKTKPYRNPPSFPGTNRLLLTAAARLLEADAGLPPDKQMSLVQSQDYGAGAEFFFRNLYPARELFQNEDFLASVLPSGIYMAETDKPLFYTPGCKPVSFRARHIVFGTFTAQEATTNEN